MNPGHYDIDPEYCDEGVELQRPRFSDQASGRNSSVLRPGNIPNRIQECIVFVQPKHKLTIDRSTQSESNDKRDAGTQTEANNSCPCCLSAEEITILKEVIESEYLQEIEQFIESIQFSATTISNLVNDLLDLAKMESNNFQFNEKYFDLITSLK